VKIEGRDGDKVAIVQFPRSGGPPLIYTLGTASVPHSRGRR
jgi:hypothetical protein